MAETGPGNWRCGSIFSKREAGTAAPCSVFRSRPGQFVLRGELLASVVPAGAARWLERAIDRYTAIGRHCTIIQDAEFGIAQIVEVAIAALCPAVNDTFTGVACVEWLAGTLLVLAENPPLERNW